MLKGKHNFTDGLWDITFDPTLQQNDKEQSPPQQNHKHDNKKGSNQKNRRICAQMRIQSFNKHIPTCHWIRTATIMARHQFNKLQNIINNLIPTAKGHLDQEQKIQSTKEEQDDFSPFHEGTKTYEYVSALSPLKPKDTSYADLTGRFPHLS